MPQPTKMGYQPVVGFLLGFLSLLISLSYFSSQLANKSLLQAKSLSSLAFKLPTSSLNAHSTFFTSAKNNLSRLSQHLSFRPINIISHIKHKTARTRNMIVKAVHSNQNRTQITVEIAFYTVKQAFNIKNYDIKNINLNLIKGLAIGLDKRTINAL